MVFCDRFIEKRSRTHDQMVQAARSGVQNIAEGSIASGTSKKTELKLTNVARASLEELLLDFEDFLRQRRLPLWSKDSPQALAVRRQHRSDTSGTSDFRTASPETAANTLVCLINQASYLLGRQLEGLDRAFLDQGGFTERLHAMRTRSRDGRSDASGAPACPACGQPMVVRTARQGARAGSQFWGCSAYPACNGTQPV